MMLSAAVDLARRSGAVAVEGWPISDTAGRSTDAFVGRERVFAEAGFGRAAGPIGDRVIMRLDV